MRREIFGSPECPLMYRWKLAGGERAKLMLHYFLPGRREQDCHDHPRSFLTLVLFGSYRDIRRDGKTDRVRAPTIRYRKATHAHVTEAGPRSFLTLVLLGRRRRPWGFWNAGRWWPWRDYEREFGTGFRCE